MVEPIADELFRRLAPEGDEGAVLSALIVEVESGFTLAQASLLIGPTSMGAGNWTDWQESHNVKGPRLAEPPRARYLLRANGAMIVRLPLSLRGAHEWLEELACAGLLDELCVTLSPLLASGDAKRISAGSTLDVLEPLDLCSICEEDNYLFLRYRPRQRSDRTR